MPAPLNDHAPSRALLHTTALVALAVAAVPAAPHAHAKDVTTKQTAPLRTATINAGAPDAITVTKDGSVVLTSGTAVTMDTSHAVSNAGTLSVTNANGANGVLAAAGTTGDITNTGTITIDEPYAPTDTDNDGDLDGPFALGSNRAGIRTAGDHTGKIVQSGTITVEGNDSAGIVLGGKLTGAFTHDGTTKIVGDRSIGIATQDIAGNVRVAGTVTAQGKDAIGVKLGGDVTGAVVIQGAIAASGYRATTAPANVTKLDADDLLQGGPAVLIEGNVSGGVVLAAAPKDNDPAKADEDADGIEDAKEGTAQVISYGAAPALAIGATGRDITLGAVAGTANGFGLQIEGTVEGRGVYSGVSATGLAIGGRGGAVTIAGGVSVSGTVAANAIGADATAIRFGSGATTGELRVSGNVAATGGNVAGTTARAVRIEAGANVAKIANAGTIKAVASAEAGGAVAISDASGTLRTVENAGVISATGAKAGEGRNVAIDLSAAGGDVTVRQTQVGAGFAAPQIVGDVRLGAGNDLFAIADGSVTGNVAFGGGANTLALSGDGVLTGAVGFGGGADTVTLAGTSVYAGAMDFGGGADVLTLADSARFTGSLANAGALAVSVSGGTLDVNRPAAIGSLAVGATGTLAVTLNKAAGQGSALTVGGTASFEQGSKLAIRLADVSTAPGSYTVLTAGSLVGKDKLAADAALVPFLFKASLAANAPANAIVVDIAKRSVAELGLNRSQAQAYDAVFANFAKDDEIEQVFLGITDGAAFRDSVGQMLPDHAGGSFEGISLGARTMARQLQDPMSPLASSGRFATAVNLGFWGSDKGAGQSAAYSLHGYAWSLTGEYSLGKAGFVGASFAYLWNQHTRGAQSNVKSTAFEGAAHWRGGFGPVSAYLRGSYGHASFEGERRFTGIADDDTIARKIKADWNGSFVTASGGVALEGGWETLFFRPAVSFDYTRLKEDGYTETGGEALDLTVRSRTSDEFAVNGGLTLGLDLAGRRSRDENWFRIETEGGWREIVGGSLGATTASFAGGTPFTLNGDDATSGWYARARAIGGSAGLSLGGEVSAEDRHGHTNLAVRGSIRIGW